VFKRKLLVGSRGHWDQLINILSFVTQPG